MLKLALFFFICALLAGLFGFTSLAGAFAGIAKILFFLFLVGCIILVVLGVTIFKSLT